MALSILIFLQKKNILRSLNRFPKKTSIFEDNHPDKFVADMGAEAFI